MRLIPGRSAIRGFELFELLALLATLAIGCVPACAAPPPLIPIEHLDVPSYLGRWYEIAKFPNRFQRQCVSDTSAEYSLAPEGEILVRNRCRIASGDFEEALGTARQVGGANSPRLRVRFAPRWLSFLPFVWGDYWVVFLDSAGDLAAVSEPAREYLWILSRSPALDEARYAALLERLGALGLDVGKLERTPQSSAAGDPAQAKVLPSGSGRVPPAGDPR